MSFFAHLRGFLRALRHPGASKARRHPGHSLALTIRDSTHVKGGQGAPRASTEAQHRIVGEGHQRYRDSFDAS